MYMLDIDKRLILKRVIDTNPIFEAIHYFLGFEPTEE
jgi:hypothetical protein